MINPSEVPIVDFTEPSTSRLISTARINEPAMRPLVDKEAELRVLEEIEGMTSRRRDLGMPLPSGMARSELLTEAHGYGWTYINAAFCYTRSTGNRFNGPERGAWYATWGPEAQLTGQTEVGWHLTRELDAVGVYENTTDYRELVAGFTTRMHNLSGCNGAPFLDDDPAVAYPAGQALARALRQEQAAGVLYPSARHEGGLCLAAFRPMLVQNIRQGATWRFKWKGSRTPDISSV